MVALLAFAQLNVEPFSDAPTNAIAVVALVAVGLRFNAVLGYLRRADKALLALVACAPLSMLWSVDPDQTLTSARILVATTTVGVFFAIRFEIRQQVRLVILAVVVAAVLSLVLMVVSPDRASIDDFRGHTWRGAFDTKNVLGRAMSFGAIAAAAMAVLGERRRRLLYAGGSALCLLLVALSWSQIAVGITALGLLAVLAMGGAARVRGRPELVGLLVIAFAVGTVAALGWVLTDVDAALEAVGRDATLTGRTGLWELVLDEIGDHPWAGYGYGAFWQGFTGPSRELWLELPWMPPHAHNGLLELMLNLGALGAVLWGMSLVVSLRRAVRAVRRHPSIDALWPLLVVCFTVVYNLTEVTGPQNNLFWTLYVAASFSLLRPELR